MLPRRQKKCAAEKGGKRKETSRQPVPPSPSSNPWAMSLPRFLTCFLGTAALLLLRLLLLLLHCSGIILSFPSFLFNPQPPSFLPPSLGKAASDQQKNLIILMYSSSSSFSVCVRVCVSGSKGLFRIARGRLGYCPKTHKKKRGRVG